MKYHVLRLKVRSTNSHYEFFFQLTIEVINFTVQLAHSLRDARYHILTITITITTTVISSNFVNKQ